VEPGTTAQPGTSICGVDTQGRAQVVLTYDDGPDPVGTPAVLEALAAGACGATFFVTLSRVKRYPDLLADVVAAGHEIGFHGVDHRWLTRLGPVAVERGLVEGKAELEDIAGRAVRWFRPPYGAQSAATWGATIRAGLTPVLWSATLEDWLDVPFSQRVLAMSAIDSPGEIVIAHDGHADAGDGADDGPAPHLDRGELCRGLLDHLAQKGLAGRSLGEALGSGAPVTRVWLTRDAPGGPDSAAGDPEG
jgi:peptidoglycan/xylan/chitin deacetylase (PgdA/CDA1 family)